MKKSRAQGGGRSVKIRALTAFGLGSVLFWSSAAAAAGVMTWAVSSSLASSVLVRWVFQPAAAVSVLAVGSASPTPVTIASSTSTTTTNTVGSATVGSTASDPAPVVPRTQIGINISAPGYSYQEREFMNLASGSRWRLVTPDGKWQDFSADQLDADQNVKFLNSGEEAARSLDAPTAAYQGRSVDIVCHWQGKATFSLSNWIVKNPRIKANTLSFTWVPDGAQHAIIAFKNMDAGNPVKNLDCREADADPNAIFAPTFLSEVKQYSVVRFMDWMNINKNAAVTWATRTKPGDGIYYGSDGVALEYMVDLANQAKVDPWFNMPWNADDNYVRQFAEYVRDHLDPSLKAYMETSNEIWNGAFPVLKQAHDEGVAEGLSPNEWTAWQYRIAEKTSHNAQIWASVFQGQESRIVRVFAWQNGSTGVIKGILDYKNAAQNFDALASAPYFTYNLDKTPLDINDKAAVDTFFSTTMPGVMDAALGRAAISKGVAASYGLRYIAYEGGQHIIGGSQDQYTATIGALNRDPRMGQLYTRYLMLWQRDIGDLMTLLSDVSPVSKYGAWGLREYVGQPLRDAPKAKAVSLFLASQGSN